MTLHVFRTLDGTRGRLRGVGTEIMNLASPGPASGSDRQPIPVPAPAEMGSSCLDGWVLMDHRWRMKRGRCGAQVHSPKAIKKVIFENKSKVVSFILRNNVSSAKV